MGLLRNNAFIYTLGSLLNSSVSFILLPFFVKNLTTDDYGNWVLIETVIIILSIIFMIGLDISMVKMVYHSESNKKHSIIKSILVTLVTSIAIMVIAFQIYIIFCPEKLLFLGLDRIYLELVVFIVTSELFSLFLFSYFRLQDDAFSFSMFSITKVLTTLSFMVLFVVLFVGGLEGAIIGRSIASCFLLIYAFKYFLPILRSKTNISIYFIKEALLYGYPLILNNLSMQVILLSDRFFVKKFQGSYEVGLYSLAYKIAAIFDVVLIRPFATIWGTYRFKLNNYRNARELYSVVITLFTFIGCFLVTLLIINNKELILIISTKEYLRAVTAFNVLVFSYFLFGLTYPVNIGLMLHNKTKLYSILTFISSIINLILNIVLIPILGINGAAIATLISYFLWLCLIYYYSQKYYYIKVNYTKLFYIITYSLINIFIFNHLLHFKNIYISIVIKTFICSLIFIIFYFLFIRNDLYFLSSHLKEEEH